MVEKKPRASRVPSVALAAPIASANASRLRAAAFYVSLSYPRTRDLFSPQSMTIPIATGTTNTLISRDKGKPRNSMPLDCTSSTGCSPSEISIVHRPSDSTLKRKIPPSEKSLVIHADSRPGPASLVPSSSLGLFATLPSLSSKETLKPPSKEVVVIVFIPPDSSKKGVAVLPSPLKLVILEALEGRGCSTLIFQGPSALTWSRCFPSAGICAACENVPGPEASARVDATSVWLPPCCSLENSIGSGGAAVSSCVAESRATAKSPSP